MHAIINSRNFQDSWRFTSANRGDERQGKIFKDGIYGIIHLNKTFTEVHYGAPFLAGSDTNILVS